MDGTDSSDFTEEELRILDEEWPPIPCKNFACLELIQNLLDKKLEQETSQTGKTIMKESFESLTYHFKHYNLAIGREQYHRRIRHHVYEIDQYFKGMPVKRIPRDRLRQDFLIY